jgi:hypothetical protein
MSDRIMVHDVRVIKLADCCRHYIVATLPLTPDQFKCPYCRIKEFEQLANEMNESESRPFPDNARNEGWCDARSFYAKELRAILDRTTAQEPKE